MLRAQKKAFEEGITGPEGHYISRPDTVEVSPLLSPCGMMSLLPGILRHSAEAATCPAAADCCCLTRQEADCSGFTKALSRKL